MTLSRLVEHDGRHTLEFDLGAPVDADVERLGFRATGYFWEGLVAYASPELAGAVEWDSEMSACVAFGDRDDLAAVQPLLESLLTDADLVGGLVRRAESEGHVLDS